MIRGKILCDFCQFIGEMEVTKLNKGTLKVPDGWISVHPTIVVHGMRGLDFKSKAYKDREKMKEKIKDKVKPLHACPRCVTERNVFDLQMALPAPNTQERDVNYMRVDHDAGVQ